MKSLKLNFTILLVMFYFNGMAQDNNTSSPTVFKIGGYAKMDVLFTQYNNGSPGDTSPMKDIHLPGAIPVGSDNSTFDTHFHIKESRFNLDFSSTVKDKPIHAFFEMDFLLSGQGDERVSNSYNPRIRHFYFEYDKLLVGQTWTTFMIVIIPEDLDFAGAAEGIVFGRQPQVRFTTNNWQFALETPETTLTPNGGGPFIISSGGFPDIIARRNFNGDWGTFSIAGIARGLRYYQNDGTRQATTGFGFTAGGKLNVGDDDIRFQATYGNGLGRYIALAFLNGAVIDENAGLKTINSVSGFVSYLHHWNSEWKSSFNYSFLNAQNDAALTGLQANKSAWSASGNLLYQPHPKLMFGGEVMYGYRQLEGGTDGSFIRVQFSGRYAFSWSSDKK